MIPPTTVPLDSPAVVSSALERTIHVGPSFGKLILGSDDGRSGILIGVQWPRSEPKLSRPGMKGDLVLETYVFSHRGGGLNGYPRDTTYAIGSIVSGRISVLAGPRRSLFAELGWGLQLGNRTSQDLGSQLNSTPVVGLGVRWPLQNGELQFTVRLMHMSNAGLLPPNLGQNHLQFLLGVRF